MAGDAGALPLLTQDRGLRWPAENGPATSSGSPWVRSYTYDELKQLLVLVLQAEQPQVVRIQDPTTAGVGCVPSGRDHEDHRYGALLAQDAVRSYVALGATPPQGHAYLGYRVTCEENSTILSSADFTYKLEMFYYYWLHDGGSAPTPYGYYQLACSPGSEAFLPSDQYCTWIARQSSFGFATGPVSVNAGADVTLTADQFGVSSFARNGSAVGGVAPYAFRWSEGAVTLSTLPISTSGSASVFTG